jgi:hypothetical protein
MRQRIIYLVRKDRRFSPQNDTVPVIVDCYRQIRIGASLKSVSLPSNGLFFHRVQARCPKSRIIGAALYLQWSGQLKHKNQDNDGKKPDI